MIEYIKFCECGAVNVTIDGNDYSMTLENFTAEYGEPESYPDELSPDKYCNCNYCINNWGTDLCACGSGEKVDECQCGFDCNGMPMQSIKDKRTHLKANDSLI